MMAVASATKGSRDSIRTPLFFTTAVVDPAKLPTNGLGPFVFYARFVCITHHNNFTSAQKERLASWLHSAAFAPVFPLLLDGVKEKPNTKPQLQLCLNLQWRTTSRFAESSWRLRVGVVYHPRLCLFHSQLRNFRKIVIGNIRFIPR